MEKTGKPLILRSRDAISECKITLAVLGKMQHRLEGLFEQVNPAQERKESKKKAWFVLFCG
jgi:hypothetical protein